MRAELRDLHSQPAEEVIEGAQRMFPGVAFHWVVRHYRGMIYEGLHDTSFGALKAKEKLVKKAQAQVAHLNATWAKGWQKDERIKELEGGAESWLSSKIDFLQENETYIPWGTGGITVTHGVNDGLHGADFRPKDKNVQRILHPSVQVAWPPSPLSLLLSNK